jgi:ABC-type glycerol-3-phosphate transport system substrate-binding protein
MEKRLYKLIVEDLKDVDGNSFEDTKNSKIFEGTSTSSDVSSIKEAKLLDNSITLQIKFNNILGKEALKSSKPRPRVVQWTQIEATLGTYLQLALVGDMTPEKALNEANAKIADILE